MDEPLTIRKALARGIAMLDAAGIDDADRQAKLLMEFAIGVSRTAFYLDPDREIDDARYHAFFDLIDRRAKREPLQYILGTWDFYGLEFVVRPGVLIPRPETELLVEKAIGILRPLDHPKFVEVGVGSGCISTSILVNVANAIAVATDVSKDALETARENAARHGVMDRLSLIETNVLDGVNVEFDLLVSNPPYIPAAERHSMQPEVVDHEPHIALFSGEDGLDVVRQLAASAARCLKQGAVLLIEIGSGQSVNAAATFDPNSYSPPKFLNDLQSIPRVLMAEKL